MSTSIRALVGDSVSLRVALMPSSTGMRMSVITTQGSSAFREGDRLGTNRGFADDPQLTTCWLARARSSPAADT